VGDLRAGVIGLGIMGRNHARVLSDLPGVTLVGIVDPIVSNQLSQGQLLRSTEELIKKGVDYCFVAVPTAAHENVGQLLASSGVHALIEKPLAADISSAKRLTTDFESRGLIGAVGHIERYNPALRQARDRIETGDLGELYQVATRRQGPFPARVADVGVVMDLATHDVDLTAWITQQRYSSLAARTGHRTGRQYEDLVTVVGELQDGVVASHTVNWLSPFKDRQTVVTGERGAFVADTLTADLTFYANGSITAEWDEMARSRGVSEGDVIRFAFPKPEPLRAEHEAFRDVVLGRDSNIVTMREGLAAVEVAQAILESAQTGQSITPASV